MGRFDDRATKPARGPLDLLRWRFGDRLFGRTAKNDPAFVTPSRAYDRDLVASGDPSLTWIGHASFLLSLAGKRMLLDPLLRDRLGPVKREAPVGIPASEIGGVDLVMITHNHRDHLDQKSLALLGEAPVFIAPVGNAAALRAAGARSIVELDWWETTQQGALTITLVPARHWSMRFPWDRNDALWGGFVIQSPQGTAYHSGDTAFFDGFAEIGERVGPIDWAMLPIGAYEPRWFMEPQHMGPEEAVEAAFAMRARTMVAMHWGTFKLTDEPLGEPPPRARAAWAERDGDPERLWILDVGETRRLTRV